MSLCRTVVTFAATARAGPGTAAGGATLTPGGGRHRLCTLACCSGVEWEYLYIQ